MMSAIDVTRIPTSDNSSTYVRFFFNLDDVDFQIFQSQNHVLIRQATMTFKFWTDDTEIDEILLQFVLFFLRAEKKVSEISYFSIMSF